MRVVWMTVLSEIRKAIDDARFKGRRLSYIALTANEWECLRFDLGNELPDLPQLPKFENYDKRMCYTVLGVRVVKEEKV